MTDYLSVRENFAPLLRWHLKENGTRPAGSPNRPGKPWKADEFALACNVGDPAKPHNAARTVRYWYSETCPAVPLDLDPIERALLGDNPAYDDWRRHLRSAHKTALAQQRSQQKILSDTTIEQQKENPERHQDQEAFNFLVQEGLLDITADNGVIAPYFLQAIWLRCSDPAFILSIIGPPATPIDTRNYIAARDPLIEKLLDHLILPQLRESSGLKLERSRALAEARYYVHLKLRTEASRLRLINVRNCHYSIANEILDEAFSCASENLRSTASRLELSCRIFDALIDEVRIRINPSSGNDPRLIEILGLFLFAIAHDCREITCAERVWHFLNEGLQQDAALLRWGAYNTPFYMYENQDAPPATSLVDLMESCKSR